MVLMNNPQEEYLPMPKNLEQLLLLISQLKPDVAKGLSLSITSCTNKSCNKHG